MNVGTASSENNPTHSYLNSKGMWLFYSLLVLLLHWVILSVPFISSALAWTLTNVIHNVGMFILLHMVKGTPWNTTDQGEARMLTQWEQLDRGQQFTGTKKFLTVVPIVLFILTSLYTVFNKAHFFINAVTLGFVIVPKLPQLHQVRLFNINKY
ncbi:ORM1-like protein 3 [Watersipora subatra]|uniref:ORM1-like protein 3 n=1 Tax=Watersipora subatra TaxID=2589382 RepID=UPI00355B89D5